MFPPSIEIDDGAFLIEASVIATGLDIKPAQVLILIRSGEITSISEQGVVEDSGFQRLTFYYRNRRFRPRRRQSWADRASVERQFRSTGTATPEA